MPNPSHDVPSSRYVLEGRVVTMGPQGIVPRCAIYVEDGVIKHVLPARAETPAEFQTAPRIKTRGTIYPGLIDLHNHLSYNAMPLWDVPQAFTNNDQWKGHEDYARKITKPSQILGGTPGVMEALVRFVECRSLLGGVTTSQGITLSTEPGIKTVYRGLVRNVEHGGDPRFPAAGTRIANLGKHEGRDHLRKLLNETCYLLHLSEGIDSTARGWFFNLRIDGDEWAITDAACGIHSTALEAEDFPIIKANGGSMVWSPLSNYLLYGDTARIEAAKAAQIRIALGCDWGPSGSKNLLGEMKVAWLVSQERGSVFTAQDIVSMATIWPAEILKWDKMVGSIEPGKRADVLVLRGQRGDDYMRVIEAREQDVLLVAIDGVPRLGLGSLLRQFGLAPGGDQLEPIRVGRSRRYLFLAEATAHPLLQNLSLTEATSRLRQAMRDLPRLAREMDERLASGLFSGSVDADGVGWRVALDFEEDEMDLALADKPLADFVQEPMELDGITAADDPLFLPRLMAAENLPAFIKDGLPALLGHQGPVQPIGSVAPDATKAPAGMVEKAMELDAFLRTCVEMSPEKRRTIVEQALVVLEQNYVHLPFKRAMHAVDPIQRLKLLRHRMEPGTEGEVSFHAELTRIFNSLRDLHTTYRLPFPFRGKVAWLPFLIEEYWEDDRRRYMVSKILGKTSPATFEPGVEVLYWNGTPIDRVVEQNAERQAGSNAAAQHTQGLNSLTLRPLGQGLPPDEEWVTLRYRDKAGRIREWTQKWLVMEPREAWYSVQAGAVRGGRLALSAALGVDSYTDDIQDAKRILYGAKAAAQEERAVQAGRLHAMADSPGGLETYLPTVFRAREVVTPHGKFGLIRIFTFNVGNADMFVDEFVRLVEHLPEDGLIIDVRGNGGGLIHAAERLLQVLTPRQIEPQMAEFIASPINLQLCRNQDPNTGNARFPELDLSPWIHSLEQSVETGASHSLGYPLTPREACNDRGQQYYGPVVLITDALCYSATDIFAAGFQDHGIGLILGTSPNTGAGGANVWSHAILRELMASAGGAEAVSSPYVPLPQGADLRVAVRRTVRVGTSAGVLIEDLGIRPDRVHRLTKQDVLGNNDDLIDEAAQYLASRRAHPLRVVMSHVEGSLPRLTVMSRNISRLDVWLDGRPRLSLDVEGDETHIDLQAAVKQAAEGQHRLELRGYEGEELAAVHRRYVNVL